MIKKILFVILFCAPFCVLSAQTQDAAARKRESDRLVALYKQMDGTYQIQVVNSRDKVEIPLAYMDTIASLRQQHEVVYFYYPDKKNVRIKILPFDVIQANGFVPPLQIAYLTE